MAFYAFSSSAHIEDYFLLSCLWHKQNRVLFPASFRKACDLKSCQVFAVENGEARSLWEQLAGHVKVLVSDQLGQADWTMYVVISSLRTFSLFFWPYSQIRFLDK